MAKKKKTSSKKKPAKKKPVKKALPKKKAKRGKSIKKALPKKIKKGKKSNKMKKKHINKKIVKPLVSKKKKRAEVEKEPDIFEGVHKPKIRIIGIGGGGGSIISEIATRINKADFLAANTDVRALKGLNKKVKKFSFGYNLTKGLGTGMNIEIGEQAALEEKEKIKKIFEGHDLCIIVACLGGGTASGATPIFAKIARSAGCLTYGIFTLPFSFEGEKKMEIAKESLKKIGPYFNVFSIMPNERIFQIIDKNTPLQDALSAINKKLVTNLEGLIEMIYLPGLINIDFADLRTVLSGYGRLAYLNTVEIAETHKEEAARKVISNSFYPYSLKGSKGILYNIVGGRSLCLSDVSRISEIISEAINKNAKIIFGINQDSKYKDKVRITLLAVGCGSKNDFIKTKTESKPKKKRPKPKSPLPVPDLKKKEEPKKEEAASNPVPKPKQEVRHKPVAEKPKPNVEAPKSEPVPKPIAKPEIKRPQSREVYLGNKVRRNALEVRKVMEQEEKDLMEKENIWDVPAIFRKKQ